MLAGEALQAVIVLYSFTLAVPLDVACALLYHYTRYHAHLGFKVVQYAQVRPCITHAAVTTKPAARTASICWLGSVAKSCYQGGIPGLALWWCMYSLRW